MCSNACDMLVRAAYATKTSQTKQQVPDGWLGFAHDESRKTTVGQSLALQHCPPASEGVFYEMAQVKMCWMMSLLSWTSSFVVGPLLTMSVAAFC